MSSTRRSARAATAPADITSGAAASGLPIDAVHDTYRLLDDNFDALYAASPTAAARAQLRALHASARDAYWKAVADGLHDDNQIVQDIRRDLAGATALIQQHIATLKDVTAVLGMLTEAVRLAGALVGLAAVR